MNDTPSLSQSKRKHPAVNADKSVPGKPKASPPDQSFDLVGYFQGVRQEWHKITWPSREQVIAETGVVVVIVAIFSVLVFAIDKIYQLIIQWIT